MTDKYLYAPQEIDPLPQKNKLKGMAMEFLIRKVIEENVETEQSIEKIKETEKAKENIDEKFKANKNFKIKVTGTDNEKKFMRQYNDFLDNNIIVPLDKLSNNRFTLYEQESTDYLDTGYKKCSNCGYELPKYVCKDPECEGAITEDATQLVKFKARAKDLENNETAESILSKTEGHWWCNCDSDKGKEEVLGTSRACRKCGKGNFRQIKIDLTKKWRKVAQNLDKHKLKQILKKEDFVSKMPLSEKIKNSRTDLIVEGKLYLLESKNKEDTKLTVSECLQACHYAKALDKAGVGINKTEIVYNGVKGSSTEEVVQKFSETNNLDINLVNIEEFMLNRSFYADEVRIGKDVDGENYGDSEEGYKVDIVMSDRPVDDIPILISGPDVRVLEGGFYGE